MRHCPSAYLPFISQGTFGTSRFRVLLSQHSKEGCLFATTSIYIRGCSLNRDPVASLSQLALLRCGDEHSPQCHHRHASVVHSIASLHTKTQTTYASAFSQHLAKMHFSCAATATASPSLSVILTMQSQNFLDIVYTQMSTALHFFHVKFCHDVSLCFKSIIRLF